MAIRTKLISSLSSIYNDLINDKGVFMNVKWSYKGKKQVVMDKLGFIIGAIEDGEMFDIEEEIGDPELRASMLLCRVLEEAMSPWDHVCRAFHSFAIATVGRFIKLY